MSSKNFFWAKASVENIAKEAINARVIDVNITWVSNYRCPITKSSISAVTVATSDFLAIWGLPNNPERFSVTSSWHLQSSFVSAQENISSVGKAEFLLWLEELFFAAFYFAVFFSVGTNFCRPRSIRKIRRKIEPQNFMLHGT